VVLAVAAGSASSASYTAEQYTVHSSKMTRPFGLWWPPCISDADIIFGSCGFFLSSSFSFPRLFSAVILTLAGSGSNRDCINDRYLEVRVLRTGSRWADRSRPIMAASRGGGNKSNRGWLGLFKIFLKNFFLFKSSRHACRDEIFAYAIAN